MRKPHTVVLGSIILLVGLAISFWFSSSPSAPVANSQPTTVPQSAIQSSSNGPVVDETLRPPPGKQSTRSPVDEFASAFAMPISYWGKVIDEKGRPVIGADVAWTANNNPDPNGRGTKGETITDADGMFFVGSHGIGLYVEISKIGYYQIPTETRAKLGSFGGFDNPSVIEKTDSPLGTRDNPAVYALHTKGIAAPLIHIKERPIRIPKNGGPIQVNLSTGQAVASDKRGLKIECWTNDQAKDAKGQYSWRCQLSVQGGGLIERKDRFGFQAPVEGYKPWVELGPSSDRWSARAEQQYFVRLPDNCYARIDFKIRTAGEHYVVLESHLNPIPGDRNLEFDPSKAAEAP